MARLGPIAISIKNKEIVVFTPTKRSREQVMKELKYLIVELYDTEASGGLIALNEKETKYIWLKKHKALKNSMVAACVLRKIHKLYRKECEARKEKGISLPGRDALRREREKKAVLENYYLQSKKERELKAYELKKKLDDSYYSRKRYK